MKKYFSRSIAMLMVVAMLAAQLLVPAYAVGEAKECTCDLETRTGTVIEQVAATCGDYGYDVYECDDCAGEYVIFTEVPTGLHDYVDHEAKEAVCGENGWKAYQTCNNCDYSTYEEIEMPAQEHNWEETGRLDAECLEDGHIDYQCLNCSATKQDTIACRGYHDYDKAVVDGDCENAEYAYYTCKDCGYVLEELLEEPLQHIPGEPLVENKVESDCVNAGSYDEVVYCDREGCGKELSRVSKTIDPLNHPETEVVPGYAATCTEDGLTDGERCTLCGADVVPQTVIPTVGHIEGAPVKENEVAPDCVNDGSHDEVVYCTVCNEELSRVNVIDAALGHDHVGTVTAPTCSEQGYTTYVCSRCDDTYIGDYVAIDPLSHNGVVTKPAKEATCTETGLTREVKCGDCGITLATQKETPIDPDNHNYESVVTKPTCEDKGYTTHTCTRCGDSYVDAEVPAKGHKKAKAVEENRVEPTCTEAGSFDSVVYCSVCGEEISRTTKPIAPLNHDYVDHEAQAQTCTEIGWDAYQTCTRCDYSTYVELPALGHDDLVVVTPPTCTEDGYTTLTCQRAECGRVEVVDPVPATGHANRETLGVVAPKCEEQGYTIWKCLDPACGLVFKDNYVDALGHDYVDHEAKAPTCTEIGWDAYQTCTRCDYTTYNELAALGHDMLTVAAQDATCTEIGWNEHTDCSRCDYKEGYVEIAAKGHRLEKWLTQESTCTEPGYTEHLECAFCDYATPYFEIAPKGHNMISVDAKAPTCTEIGWDAYEYCTECDHTTYNELDPLGHTEVIDEAVAPTYDTTGLTEGMHCGVCDEVIIPQEVVAALDEVISFSYETMGINGSNVAVNSGYITLNVYMNVETDIARLYGLDFDINFNENLTLINVMGKVFDVTANTIVDDANINHKIELGQNMGYNYVDKEFKAGRYLFATLTFKVDKAFTGVADFNIVPGAAARNDDAYINNLIVNFGSYAGINVAMLGDANYDGIIDTVDTMNFAKWYNSAEAAEGAYNTVYDLDKDGYVTAFDFDLLHNAVVGNDGYLGD